MISKVIGWTLAIAWTFLAPALIAEFFGGAIIIWIITWPIMTFMFVSIAEPDILKNHR